MIFLHLKTRFHALGSPLLTNLSRVSSLGDVCGSDYVFDVVHFLLVPFSVPQSRLLGFVQSSLQNFHSFGRGSQPPFQLGQLTAKVCIIPNKLKTAGGDGE